MSSKQKTFLLCHGAWGGGGGVEKIGRPSDDYLKTFEHILHPDGL